MTKVGPTSILKGSPGHCEGLDWNEVDFLKALGLMFGHLTSSLFLVR